MKDTLAKKLLTSCLVLSLVTFLSCGHQQKREENGLFSDMGQGADDSSLMSGSSQYSEEAVTTEAASEERSVATSSELEATLDAPPADTSEASSDPLALPPMEDAASSSDLGTTTSEGTDTAALDLSTPPMEATPAEAIPTESAPMEPAQLMPETASTEGIPSNIGSTTTEAPTPEVASQEASVAAEPKAVVAVNVRTPEVPKESVWRKGQTLNRYYFVRNGDSAESVSQMIFGSEAQAETLKSLNPGKWVIGKLVMYTSPENAKDVEMQSFYEERGVSPEEYTVQRGDWLSKISTQTYGHAQSWKEIAAVNGLRDPNQLKVGMKISLYPAEMPAAPSMDRVAVKAPVVEELPEVEARPQVPAQVEAPKQSEPRAAVAKAKPDLASPEVGGFFQENFALVATGLAFLMAVYFIRRRMRRTSDLTE